VKLGEPRNWEKLGIHVGNVRVEKTSKSVIIHSGQLSGFNEYYLMMEAGQIQAIVKAVLLVQATRAATTFQTPEECSSMRSRCALSLS
jgi:hypothetical protein